MDNVEVGKILGLIKIAYPNSYKHLDKLSGKEQKDETDRIVLLWLACLNDIDFKDAQEGLIEFVKNDRGGFAPAIGELRGAIEDNIERRRIESAFQRAILKSQKESLKLVYAPFNLELGEGNSAETGGITNGEYDDLPEKSRDKVEYSTFDPLKAFEKAIKMGMKTDDMK